MKNRKNKKNQKHRSSFILLKRRITLRFSLYIISIFTGFFIFLQIFHMMLRRGLNYLIADVLEFLFNMDYYTASNIYWQIRSYYGVPIICLVAVITIFVSFRLCIKRVTKYLNDIRAALGQMNAAGSGEIILPEELEDIEDGFRSAKETLERRTAEAKQSEQRKNDLIVYLAHDLKTPLTSVIGYLTLLRDEKDISEELRQKYLSISYDKAQRLEDLINEFFDITRFNLTDIELQYSNVNLTRLLEQSAYEFQPMLSEKDLTYSLHAAENIMLKCDADKLQRVIDNLLRNAVFYSYENTAIDINVIQTEREIAVSVKNRGDTIPPEKLGRLFEQFFRLDSSRGTNKGGAGLGLAIAKKIAELHGGRIEAKSEDNTVEFILTVPCYTNPFLN